MRRPALAHTGRRFRELREIPSKRFWKPPKNIIEEIQSLGIKVTHPSAFACPDLIIADAETYAIQEYDPDTYFPTPTIDGKFVPQVHAVHKICTLGIVGTLAPYDTPKMFFRSDDNVTYLKNAISYLISISKFYKQCFDTRTALYRNEVEKMIAYSQKTNNGVRQKFAERVLKRLVDYNVRATCLFWNMSNLLHFLASLKYAYFRI